MSGLVLGSVSKRSMNKIHRCINKSRELGDIELFYFCLFVFFVFKLKVSLLFWTYATQPVPVDLHVSQA